MAKNKRRKKMEFSKILFILTTVLVTCIVVYSMILMWRTNDTSALSYLIPSAFAELATATGFYYNKAKKENEIKLAKKYGKEFVNDDDDYDYHEEDYK